MDRAVPVNILRGQQFDPAFLAFSPNGKIPALVDPDGAGPRQRVTVFETGAILLYLAEKFGRFIPAGVAGRAEALEWLFFQCSNLGPMLGQATHFRRYAAEPVPYAVERYTTEATRLYGVLEQRLAGREWIAAGEYGIADMASFPWMCRFRRQGQDIETFPKVKGWLARVSARPAVGRGMDVLKEAFPDLVAKVIGVEAGTPGLLLQIVGTSRGGIPITFQRIHVLPSDCEMEIGADALPMAAAAAA